MKSDQMPDENSVPAQVQTTTNETYPVWTSEAGMEQWPGMPEDAWVTMPLQPMRSDDEPQRWLVIRKRDVRQIVRE